MTTRLLGLFTCLSLLAGAPAFAQSTDARERAKAHYQKGKALQQAGKHGEAVAEYQAAYQLAPLPGMLFNLGQAYRLHGDRAQAMEHYQKYLAVEPAGQGSAEARRHLDSYTAAILREEEAARRKAADDAEARRRTADDEARRKAADEEASRKAADEEARREAADEEARREAADEQRETDARNGTGRDLRVAGLVTGAVGVGLLGGGVFFGVRAKSLAAEVEDARGAWSDDLDDKARRAGPAAERNMFILGAAGIVCAGVGSYLYLRGARARSEAWSSGGPIGILPAVGPARAGIVVSGSF